VDREDAVMTKNFDKEFLTRPEIDGMRSAFGTVYKVGPSETLRIANTMFANLKAARKQPTNMELGFLKTAAAVRSMFN
jgi:hypothetical protein